MHSHVPPPEPSAFWVFMEGVTRTICERPLLTFQVTRVHLKHIDGVETLGAQMVEGNLLMDRPVVVSRDNKTLEPLITLTLRKIHRGKAYIQVTAHHPGLAVSGRLEGYKQTGSGGNAL